jgi:hypothetical protein
MNELMFVIEKCFSKERVRLNPGLKSWLNFFRLKRNLWKMEVTERIL